MDEELGSESVREQLIAAGTAELEAHGIADFSLRRVAAACNSSCAAPYKHFKNRGEFINSIFAYIKNQLDLLLDQVKKVYPNDPKTQLIESCMAYIRFCTANPHFRAVLMLAGGELPLAGRVKKLVPLCLAEMSKEKQEDRCCVIRSVAYGAALMLERGEIEYNEAMMRRIRESIARELESR